MSPIDKRELSELCIKKGIIGIDGRCGSGKTALASYLRSKWNCPVFHMDDYYLPFDQRPSDWKQIPAANMDLTRIKEEILLPFQRNQPIHTRKYNAKTDSYYDEQVIDGSELIIVEGSYSLHPLLRDAYADTIFLTCSMQIQKERLKKREGENYSMFEELWIPLEEQFFQQYHIEEVAHWRICTDEGGTL